jgi:hypothetical protein
MNYYIVDTTLKPAQVKQFLTYPTLVKYLNGISQRAYGQTRKERMILLEELGNGYDDPDSVNFVRSIAESFEMGVIRKDAGGQRRVKCDVTTIALFQKEEFGS